MRLSPLQLGHLNRPPNLQLVSSVRFGSFLAFDSFLVLDRPAHEAAYKITVAPCGDASQIVCHAGAFVSSVSPRSTRRWAARLDAAASHPCRIFAEASAACFQSPDEACRCDALCRSRPSIGRGCATGGGVVCGTGTAHNAAACKTGSAHRRHTGPHAAQRIEASSRILWVGIPR